MRHRRIYVWTLAAVVAAGSAAAVLGRAYRRARVAPSSAEVPSSGIAAATTNDPLLPASAGTPPSLTPSAAAVDAALAPDVLTSREVYERRGPLLRAIARGGTDPTAAREAIVRALDDSGASHEAWTLAAGDVFASFARGLPADVAGCTALSAPTCFHLGCRCDATFRTREDGERAAESLRRTARPDARHGGFIETPLEGGDAGAARAVWIILRPAPSP